MFRSFKSEPSKGNVASLYTPEKIAGTRYAHLGSRTGLASVLDDRMIEKQMRDEQDMWGDGFIQYEVKGKPNAPMNIDGRLFYPDAAGLITVIDSDLVQKTADLETEKRKYLEDIIEKASMSDEICTLILAQRNVVELKNILGKGKSPIGAGGAPIITDPDLLNVDAMPSAIETYDPTGTTFSRAIQKFKIVVRAKLPALQSMTNKKVQNEA